MTEPGSTDSSRESPFPPGPPGAGVGAEADGRAGGSRRAPWLALGAGCLALFAVEGGLRLAGWHERTDFFQFESQLASGATSEQHVFHAERFYGVAPHFRAADQHTGRYATGDYDGRGRPPEPAPAGLRRVVVAGDSCVFGYGLDTADTLSEALARRLADQGWDPTQVQVLNRGTNGYSTVQIDLAVEEALARWEPEVVVLYPAAWNDQSPAMGVTDLALIDARRSAGLRRYVQSTASYNALRSLVGGGPSRPELSREEITAQWEAGAAPYGTRVPESAVEQQVSRTLARIAAAGAQAVVIVPAHPLATLERHPRTGADAAAVARAAEAAGVPWIDARELLAESVAERRAFLDFVHPTPPSVALLAAAVAEPVLTALGPPPADERHGPRFAVRRLAPERAPSLGDVTVTVELDDCPIAPGLAGAPADELVVTVGGAPLLDLVWAGLDSVAGTLVTNAPGALDVVVQTAEACAFAPRALELVAPTFRLEPGPPALLVLDSRPGDRGLPFVGTRVLEQPTWGVTGAEVLDRAGVLYGAPSEVERLELDGGLLRGWPDEVWLQGLVRPRGTGEDRAVLRLSGPTRAHVR